MFDSQNIRDVGYWKCEMLKMRDAGDKGRWDVGCLGCGMFRLWDV